MRIILILIVCLELTASKTSENKIICFYEYDMHYINYVNSTLCTHLLCSYAPIWNGRIDINDTWANYYFDDVMYFSKESPTVKIMLSVEGTIREFITCSERISDSTCRAQVTDHIVEFTKYWGFHGLNLFWDLKNTHPGPPEDRQNIIELLRSLKMRCNTEGLIFSASVHAGEIFASRLYNIPEMSKYLDFINLMTFNYYDASDKKTGFGAPLQAVYYDTAPDKTKSVEASIIFWLSKGAPREKLIVGTTSIGPTFTLKYSNANGVGAPIKGRGRLFPLDVRGFARYSEIVELQWFQNWSIVFDVEHQVPYTFKGNLWIAYENIRSVREKAELIARLNLGGAMHTDLYADLYDHYNRMKRFPLLRTVNAVLRNGEPVPEEAPSLAVAPLQCTQAGYMHNPDFCGLIMCAPKNNSGYNEYHFECRPGNCSNPLIGAIGAEMVDYNFFVCGD